MYAETLKANRIDFLNQIARQAEVRSSITLRMAESHPRRNITLLDIYVPTDRFHPVNKL